MTVPEPVPAIITVTAYVIGGGGGGGGGGDCDEMIVANVAVHVNVFAGIGNDGAQGAGAHPEKVEPVAGTAPSVTVTLAP